ncbi:aminoglycoside phosphotransferase family protein [Actinokineospora sp. PR83]|uniref:aminoglycoside phosphotransferase family protein n=1 Tax=Actinokineospora sp. PR83 TaxID=2884908 RepID=UPI001F197932|nr:aminoglycoside phosphotransferase family protein [Actinokineospora sp. PR83]MCG8914573.1 aminoglycoside phosphotransferase family protein [Actinokineospora sp. PR83]
MITEEERTARSARARDAAVAAATDLGLDASAAVVVYDVFSVVVDLAPSPVVARVPVVTPRGTSPAGFQRTELAVSRWLAGRGEPTVVPSGLVPAEPVVRDGFAMTFWEKVDGVLPPDYDVVGRMPAVARLHSVLAEYPGEVGFFPGMQGYVDSAFDDLAGRADLLPAADLARARAEWAALSPAIASPEAFARVFPGVPVQVVHGDAPYFNLIETADAVLYSDFEHVGLAPVEWDLAHTGAEAIAAYDAAAVDLGLRPVDPAALRAAERLRDLQAVACLALVPELPLLVDGLASTVETWRGTEPWA